MGERKKSFIDSFSHEFCPATFFSLAFILSGYSLCEDVDGGFLLNKRDGESVRWRAWYMESCYQNLDQIWVVRAFWMELHVVGILCACVWVWEACLILSAMTEKFIAVVYKINGRCARPFNGIKWRKCTDFGSKLLFHCWKWPAKQLRRQRPSYARLMPGCLKAIISNGWTLSLAQWVELEKTEQG